ncbi:MAG: alpha/beta hydrolase [Bryobacteraceae bacterium]
MPERLTFTAPLDCYWLLEPPESIDSRSLAVVALHGYGSNPEVMMRLTRAMLSGALGAQHAIAALQGPYPFYPDTTPGSPVGYGWITRSEAAASIRLHHLMLLHVFSDLERRYGLGADRRLLVGFSQPVGLNYRFSATHPDQVRGVVGICGGLPKDWDDGDYRSVPASLLHIARSADEFYPPEVTEKYAERLRLRASDVEFHQLEGGHRFPSKAGLLVEPWIERVFLSAP